MTKYVRKGRTMRRVKAMWSAIGSVDLENKINEWFEMNPDVEPINIAFSRTGDRYSSLILYEVKEDVKQI